MDANKRLSELSNGYQHAIVLLTAARAGVFAAMGRQAQPADALARRLGFDARALEIVLLALAADGIVTREDDGFRIHPDFAPLLLPDSPTTQDSILKHNYACMKRWMSLDEVLRTGRPASEPAALLPHEDMRNFICGMANISRLSSAEVAARVDLSGFRRMIDVGGGPATSSIVFCQKYPQLNCVVFDLPGPLRIAREEIARAGMDARIETRAGDYFRDELGEGFDLAYVSNIIHSMGPDDSLMLMRKCHRALTPDGTLLVKDFFLDDSRTAPNFAAFFSVNMLTGTAQGKSYTLRETQDLLARAGFGDFRHLDVAAASGLLIARKA